MGNRVRTQPTGQAGSAEDNAWSSTQAAQKIDAINHEAAPQIQKALEAARVVISYSSWPLE